MKAAENWKDLMQEAAKIAKEVFEELHSWPEPGNEEFRTVTLIGKKLKELGLGIERPLATAVVANIPGEKEGGAKGRIAFRADLDALPITETALVSYRSRRAGMMHACGHDAHAAMLVGLAHVLSKGTEQLPWDVRLIFQPDEEGTGGAKRLVERGVLDGVDAIFGYHVKPDLTAGTVGIQYGSVHGESITFRAVVQGASAHGAKPELGRDAVYGAAQFISMCQGIISRDLQAGKAGVITFGRIQGGEGGNILAKQVTAEGIIRGEDSQVCQLLSSRMNILARGLSQALGLTITVDMEQGYKALVNDSRLVDQVRRAAAGPVIELKRSSMTVDDFSFYLEKVPGAYFFLGSGFENRENSGLHTGRFQVNQDCLKTGIETLVNLCMAEPSDKK